MMLPSISKYKLYLYISFFIFLSSMFNFKFLDSFKDKFSLKEITLSGISQKEEKILKNELNNLRNINIFKLNKNKVLETINKFNFLENIYVSKIIPSTIHINLSRTSILGKTLINGETFFIGKNGKFINSKQIFENNKIPMVFGDFKIQEFLNIYNILNSNHLEINQIDKYYYFKNKRWDILFYNGTILKLPSKKFEDSVKIYKQLIDDDNFKNIKIIDLRVTDQIILTNKNE